MIVQNRLKIPGLFSNPLLNWLEMKERVSFFSPVSHSVALYSVRCPIDLNSTTQGGRYYSVQVIVGAFGL